MRLGGGITVAAVLAVAAACGSSTGDTNQGQQTPDGGAAGNGSSSGGQADAGKGGGSHDASSEQTPPAGDASGPVDAGPYPADHYPLPLMQNFGGDVLSAPKVVTVTFVGDANRDAERTFDDMIIQSDWWTTVTDGWPISKGTGGVYAELPPDAVAGKTLDDSKDLQPLLASWIASGALPPPQKDTLYAIYFPSTTTITLAEGTQTMTSCQDFGGYHNSATLSGADAGAVLVSDGGAGQDFAYAVLPACGSKGASTVTVSHEFIEAATDAHPATKLGWYGYQDAWWPAGGYEVADACEGRGSITVNGSKVARSWNNKAAAASHDPCQPEAPGEIFYSAAVPTTVVKNIPDPTGGPNYDSDGYILMQHGTSQTIDVAVFSEAQLPNDLQLVVGATPANWQGDPQQVDPVGTGITATLSPTTGHNGTHVTLTLDVAASAAPGDYPFFVRGILTEPTDYHSWWVVLRVQ